MVMSAEKEQGEEYFNFINSLNSEGTKKTYAYHLEQFLNFLKSDLHSFQILSVKEKEQLIIQYLVQKKVSAVHKNLILSAIRHACEINDVILNWKKIKKFIRSSPKTDIHMILLLTKSLPGH